MRFQTQHKSFKMALSINAAIGIVTFIHKIRPGTYVIF